MRMNVTLAYFATETATATDRERWKPGVSIKPSIKHAAIARHRCTGGTETVSGVRRSGIADWRNKKNKGPSWRSTMLTPYSTKAARHSTATAKTRKNERNPPFRSFFLVFAVAFIVQTSVERPSCYTESTSSISMTVLCFS